MASLIWSSPTTSNGVHRPHLLHSRWSQEVVSHAGVVQGGVASFVAQPRRWQIRGRHGQGRTARQHLQILGLALLDANGDGGHWLWPTTRTQQAHVNTGKGTFTESAVSAGIAFSEDGVARAGMGIDAADYDRSGKQSIIIGNFSNQMTALHHNEGNGRRRRGAAFGGGAQEPAHARLRLLLL